MSKQQGRNKAVQNIKCTVRRKNIILLVSFFSVIALSVGTTLAFIFTNAGKVENIFNPAYVSCEVTEKFEDNIKSDVKIKNNGNAEAYIRATIAVTWIDDSGNVYAIAPQKDTDYTITLAENFDKNWLIDSNEFYYCKAPVASDSETPQLINECRVIDGKAPDGYHLSIEIIASAIQSVPPNVVTEQWGVTVADGNITRVPN